jgi:hypothetical protein
MSKICEHIKENGSRCGSPAMYQRDFCFYHWRLHTWKTPITEPAYELPSLDTEAGVQLAAIHVLRSLIAGKIEPYKAQTMLSTINVIANSLRRNQDSPGNDQMVKETTPAMEKLLGLQADTNFMPEKKPPVALEEIFSSGTRG